MHRFDSAKSALIDLVEAAYCLPAEESDWLERVLAAGLSAASGQAFVSGITFNRTRSGGRVQVQTWRHAGAPNEVEEAVMQHAARIPKEVEHAWFRPGLVETGSQVSEDSCRFVEAFASSTGIAADVLLVNAIDPDGRGAYIAVFLAGQTKLDPGEHERWRMLGAHLTTGHRVWRAVATTKAESTPLPFGAEAVLDAKTLKITEAAGLGKDRSSALAIRDSARQVDRARGALRKTAPDEALQTWWAMMHGRWSILDWFDSDQRRYVLAIPNPPDLGDPRGLTERELQVATYAALGESGKLISYRLGLSKASVSNGLEAAMRKLGVKTRPQLVEKMHGFAKYFAGATQDVAS